MKHLALLFAFALSACSSSLPTSPAAVIPPVQTAPASIRLTLATRPDRTTDVTATVLTADGHFVPDVALTFALERGTVTPDTATTNSNGLARALVTSDLTTMLTVSTGTLAASISVDALTPIPPLPPITPRPPPTPAPPPAPPPPTPPPQPTLAASLTCAPVVHGQSVLCNVSATYGDRTVPASTITETRWDWGDGSPVLIQTIPPSIPLSSHRYGQLGTYSVVVEISATTVDGVKFAGVAMTLVIP